MPLFALITFMLPKHRNILFHFYVQFHQKQGSRAHQGKKIDNIKIHMMNELCEKKDKEGGRK